MSAVYWFSPSARYFHVMDCVGSLGRAGAGAGADAGVGPGRLVTVSCGAAAFAGAAGDATLALLPDAKCGAGACGPRGVNLLNCDPSSGSDNFLIDGFPRNEDNLVTWNREMGDRARVLFVLFLDCDQQTCIERCLHRGTGR